MAFLDHLVVVRGDNMRKLKNCDMKKITGGNITASFLTSFAISVSTILDVGRTLGSSVRRLFGGKYCSM